MPRAFTLRALLLFLLPLFLCLGSAKLLAQENVGNIVGELRIARGVFPDHRIKLMLLTRGVMVGETYADNDGRFTFSGLPGNTYRLVIQDDAFEPVDEFIQFDPYINPNKFVRITLTPKPKRTEGTSPPDNQGVSGGNPYMVTAADYNKRFAKKVLREFDAGVESDSKQQTAEAIKHFRKAVALAPDFYPAHNNLGSVYLKQGELKAAAEEFLEVIRLNPNDGAAYYNVANVMLMAGDHDDALRAVQEGQRRQPKSAFGLFVLGSIYTRTNRPQEAERALREAMRLDPALGYVRLQLIKLYLGEHHDDQAVAELKGFLKDFPNDSLAPKARALLAKLEAATPPSSQPK